MPTPTLLQRLKERKLVQWALAYLAGAFVVFQSVEVMAEPWGISPALQRGVHIVLVVGLFITLILAWYHGEKGRQRASGPELLMVAALLVIAGGVLSVLRPERETNQASQALVPLREGDDRPSIAVLPCVNMSPDPGDEYLAEGIHEEILLRLQRISALYSIGRTSVLRYGENPPPVTEIATALQVGSVGECSVRKQEARIRVTFQLLDGSTGGQVWAENYDTTLTTQNLFDIQSDIAQQIAQAMRAVLSPEERARIEANTTDNLEAYNAYLLGRYWWNRRTSESTQEAIRQFEEAIRLDSTFALAYVGLADSYMIAPWYGEEFIPTDEARTRGLAAAQRALEIDDRLGEAHASLAAIQNYFQWNWTEAGRAFQRAIELSPRYAMAHQWYGLLLLYSRRLEEAEARLRFALNLDPLYQTIHQNIGQVLLAMGRYDEAIEHLERTIVLFPGFAMARERLAVAYLYVERYEEAIGLLPASGYAPKAYMALGRRDEALALAERFEQEGSVRERLRARTGMGDVEGAFAMLEEALETRAPWLLSEPNINPYYESLHSDPRWADYLRRIGVEQESKTPSAPIPGSRLRWKNTGMMWSIEP